MSDPYVRAQNRTADDRLRSPPVIDGNPGSGIPWLLVALAFAVILAIVWFSVAPPQGDQQTSAMRPPIATDIETTGRSIPR
jgi:hypothetical protein